MADMQDKIQQRKAEEQAKKVSKKNLPEEQKRVLPKSVTTSVSNEILPIKEASPIPSEPIEVSFGGAIKDMLVSAKD